MENFPPVENEVETNKKLKMIMMRMQLQIYEMT